MSLTSRLALACVVAGATLAAPAALAPRAARAAAPCAAPANALVYNFEDGTDGFTAPSWRAANNGQPAQSTAQVDQGTYSLALPVRFTGGGYDESAVDKVFDNYIAVDLTSYGTVTYDVYAPVAGLYSQLIFNDPWYPASDIKPLNVGWNAISFDISPSSQDFPNSGAYFSSAKEFLLEVIGKSVTYTGNVYFDDVRFNPSTTPFLQVRAPQTDDTLSVPEGQTYTIQACAAPTYGNQLTDVRFSTPAQTGALSYDSASGLYTGAWDLWREGEGLKTLTITATDSSGAKTTAQATVLVQDSQLRVRITSPTFDQQLAGATTVMATLTPDPRFALQNVSLVADDHTIPMQPVAGQSGAYGASLPTQWLRDGVQTLRVVAHDTQFTVTDLVDVLVENHPRPAHFVHATRFVFTDGGRFFTYVGWNEYDLFTRQDQTVAHDEQTSQGNIILKGTVIPWQEQIDRQMLEAERLGLTVLRTWAFDSSPGDGNAFETGPGQYNEAAYQKLDYIMASAARHHMRVILALDNYWPDYGGIQQESNWLGLQNKLQFFTDPKAQALYEQNAAHLINRVNTVTSTPYRDDPTIFSWELMNEPRMDCADDPTPNHQYCDPTGQTLRSWIATMSTYVKSLDPNHMVSTGAEGHGLVPGWPIGQGIQWARSDEGDGNTPYLVQNVPNVDFFTFHPYPNASWANFTLPQTLQLIGDITLEGALLGKPVVMEEYGLDRAQPLNLGNTELQPTDPSYPTTRVQWYKAMLDRFYGWLGAGSNIWQLTDWSDNNYNVNPYLPQADATRDAPLVAVLAREAARHDTSGSQPWS